MPDLTKEITQCLNAFVFDISQLAKHSAASAVERALTRELAGPQRRPPGRLRGTERPKRSQADLDELASRFLAYVRLAPGLRIEQINRQLGTQTKDMALPIRKLIASGHVTTKGAKRSTTYFARGAEDTATR